MPIPGPSLDPLTEIVSLDDVDDEINGVDIGKDGAELQGLIDAVSDVVEEIVGPVRAQSRSEFYDGGSDTIVLRACPVVSVDAVTEYSPSATTLAAEPYGTATFTASGYRVNLETGTLLRTSGGNVWRFCRGSGNVQVDYTAGRTSVPASVRTATLELIRVHWRPQQAGNLPGMSGGPSDDFAGTTVLGYFVPNRVLDLLQPEQRGPRVGAA